MATSGSTDWSVTRNEIIRQALLLCNAIDPQETVPVQQQSDATYHLNAFIKRITMERPLFGYIDHTIPLYDDGQTYTVGSGGNKNVARPVQISQARRVNSGATTENDIEILSRKEFMELPSKDSTGEVNVCYYDPQLSLGVLYVWPVASGDSTSLSDGSTNNWTVSGTATEYYYTGSDISEEPSFVFISNSGTMVEMTKGTVGSLSQYEYGWGDNDAIGSNALYVWSATDPDATSGSVKVLTTSTPSKIIITSHRPLEDFDSATDNPDLPQEAIEMLTYGLASLLAPTYNISKAPILKQLADEQMNLYMSSDTEPAGLKIEPKRYY